VGRPSLAVLALGLLPGCTSNPDTETAHHADVDASFQAPVPPVAPPPSPVDASFEAQAPLGDPIGDPNCPHPPVQSQCSHNLCRIEPGCFLMGSPRDEPGAAADDIQVQVTLTRPFLIGRRAVQRGTWIGNVFELPTFTREEDGPAPCIELGCPVVYVSFEEALMYTNRLSEGDGLPPCYELSDCTGTFGQDLRCASIRTTSDTPYECTGYRLPMEAEWEYAARAGTRTAFYSGDILPMDGAPDAALPCRLEPNLERIAWYCHNSDGQPQRVAQKDPNGWDLLDMLGNVAEFCNDLQHGGYAEGPLTDPVGTVIVDRELTHPEHNLRIVRGGSYLQPSAYTKASTRMTETGANIRTGFRIARTCFPDLPCLPQEGR
jgi:formylglycine-generating enzyme